MDCTLETLNWLPLVTDFGIALKTQVALYLESLLWMLPDASVEKLVAHWNEIARIIPAWLATGIVKRLDLMVTHNA
ncbi:MAG: hypothetical protein AAGA84_07420 [Pseudomonadota bacterium]